MIQNIREVLDIAETELWQTIPGTALLQESFRESSGAIVAQMDQGSQSQARAETVDQWNDTLLSNASAETALTNEIPYNESHSNGNGQIVSQSGSAEKARSLPLLDGVQESRLVTELSILDKFKILPFQLSLAPPILDGNNTLTQELSEAAREQNQQHMVVAIGTGVSVALTAGFVSWLLKAGVLISATKSSAPLWSAIDPVPILYKHDIS